MSATITLKASGASSPANSAASIYGQSTLGCQRRSYNGHPTCGSMGHPLLTCKPWLAYSRAVGDVYQALADSTRRLILDELIERDGQSLFELCGRLAMRHGVTSTRQAISQHLTVLEQAGLVSARRSGRTKIHHIHTEPLREITARWTPDQKD